MKLIVQPDNGLNPLLRAVRRATRSIEVVVFRLDRVELEKALASAVTRGVVVRMLVASTNGGKEKALRKLEKRLLEGGITVTRTADDLPRYHGKMAIIDGTLFVLGFNYTRQDIERSRSFGLITRDAKLVKEASRLFEADSTRQPYAPGDRRFVVSPETSRERLSEFIGGARKQLLIYDNRVSDRLMLRLLRERVEAGVEIRMIGRIDKTVDGLWSCRLADLRLHVRTIVRDGASVFLGSQSLCKNELDARREIGLIVNDRRIAGKVRAVFEADWTLSAGKDKALGKDGGEGVEAGDGKNGSKAVTEAAADG